MVKEAVDVYGYPSTFGWNETSFLAGGVDLFPLQNAAAVQLLLDAGAIIIGKSTIPPFSSGPSDSNASWVGPTFNAVNPALKPGSSSTGTGTAVAAGFAVWGVAEETGGSIQLPADAQSLVGLKTTCAFGTARRVHLAQPFLAMQPCRSVLPVATARAPPMRLRSSAHAPPCATHMCTATFV